MPLKKADIIAPPDAVARALLQAIEEKGYRVYTVIDHRKDIEGSGAAPFTAFTIVFGNPKLSSMLLAKSVEISTDLPLRISVVSHGDGCRVVWRDMHSLLSDFQIANSADAANLINGVFEGVMDSAAAKFHHPAGR